MKILDEGDHSLVNHANPDGMKIMFWLVHSAKMTLPKGIINIPILLFRNTWGHDNKSWLLTWIIWARPKTCLRQQLHRMGSPIIYNHHQSGPAGNCVAGPPYSRSLIHVFDPLIIYQFGIAVGMLAMIQQVTPRRSTWIPRDWEESVFLPTWWNGGFGTTPYFHNQIGINWPRK